MKKIFGLMLICSVYVAACNKKASPAASPTSGGSQPSTSKTQGDNPPVLQKTDAQNQADLDAKKAEEAKQADVAAAAKVGKPSPEVAGKTIYETKCAKCHGVKNVSAFTASQWDSILKSMVPKAKLSAEEEEQVTAYVRAHAK